MRKHIDADELVKALLILEEMQADSMVQKGVGRAIRHVRMFPPADVVEVVRCKDCKHNPKETWFGCPMTHLSERQRPEDAWCWRGERIDD